MIPFSGGRYEIKNKVTGSHIFVNSTKLIPLVYVFFTALESFDTTLDIDYNKD